MVLGDRAAAHLRPRSAVLSTSGARITSRRPGGQAPRRNLGGPDESGHPVLAAEDGDGCLVRPLVWPVEKAKPLDGSHCVYAVEPVPEPATAESALEPSPVFPAIYVKASLSDDEPEQLTLAAPFQRKPSPAKTSRRSPRRPAPALRRLADFAESVFGRQDIPEDSLIADFKRLSHLSDDEDQLQIDMGMDPFDRLSERFPWLDAVADIATQQGFFHWEFQFAQVFTEGGFDLQLGNPPWVRPERDGICSRRARSLVQACGRRIGRRQACA